MAFGSDPIHTTILYHKSNKNDTNFREIKYKSLIRKKVKIMFNSNCASVPLVASIDGGYGGNNGFLNGDGLWGLIIILALLGWGGNGFGGFGGGFGGNGGYSEVQVQRGFDQNAVINKLDGLTYGLSDSTYALTGALNTGFNSVQQTLCQGFNGISREVADCCCTTQGAIKDVRYDLATQACDTRHAIQDSTRDIIDNANANNRALLDFLVKDKIETLQAENQSLRLTASQERQNNVLRAAMDANTAEIIRRTGNECPIPAYVVPNPNCCYNPFGFNYGNNGCGCGCNY